MSLRSSTARCHASMAAAFGPVRGNDDEYEPSMVQPAHGCPDSQGSRQGWHGFLRQGRHSSFEGFVRFRRKIGVFRGLLRQPRLCWRSVFFRSFGDGLPSPFVDKRGFPESREILALSQPHVRGRTMLLAATNRTGKAGGGFAWSPGLPTDEPQYTVHFWSVRAWLYV
jgi:hypothetical protein